jgi:hypothetical protein
MSAGYSQSQNEPFILERHRSHKCDRRFRIFDFNPGDARTGAAKN